MFNAAQFCIDYNIDYSTDATNGWIGINCPFCNDHKYHGAININGGYFNCWKCGGFPLDKTIQKLLLLKRSEAIQIINEYDSHTALTRKLNNKKIEKVNVNKIDMIGGSLEKIHRKYLKSRGFNPDYLIDKYQITGTTISPPNYKFRIIVPIFHNGKLVSYQGRAIKKANPLRWKGLSPEKSVINYKHTLYGLQFTNNEQIGVVEGIADQWKMGDGFVCSFGTALTNHQLKLLSNYQKVFFLFDPGAQDKAKKYAKLLAGLKNDIEVECVDLELPNEKDPGDLDQGQVAEIRNELGFV